MGSHGHQDAIGSHRQAGRQRVLHLDGCQRLCLLVLPVFETGTRLLGESAGGTRTHLDFQEGRQVFGCAGKGRKRPQQSQGLMGMRRQPT